LPDCRFSQKPKTYDALHERPEAVSLRSEDFENKINLLFIMGNNVLPSRFIIETDMSNDETKLILRAYRPDGQDASDTLFAGALEQVQHNREVQKWFAEERAFDSRLQANLRNAITFALWPRTEAPTATLKKLIFQELGTRFQVLFSPIILFGVSQNRDDGRLHPATR
jgi:hypothetical protein